MMESKSGWFLQHARRVALSAPGKFLLAAAVMISLVSIPLLTKADQTNEARKLTGNWMVTVRRGNPPPTLAPTFLSLGTVQKLIPILARQQRVVPSRQN